MEVFKAIAKQHHSNETYYIQKQQFNRSYSDAHLQVFLHKEVFSSPAVQRGNWYNTRENVKPLYQSVQGDGLQLNKAISAAISVIRRTCKKLIRANSKFHKDVLNRKITTLYNRLIFPFLFWPEKLVERHLC